MSINDALSDEITSINSIYEPDTLVSLAENGLLCSLRLPSLPSVTLRLDFPTNYPDAPPSILGTQTVGDDVHKGVGNQVVDITRSVLSEIYRPGEACIFDLLEEVKEALEKAEEQGHLQLHDEPPAASTVDSAPQSQTRQIDLGPEPPWIIGPVLTEKKSVFVGRVAHVSSPAQAKSYLAHLLATDKKVAKATHNMTAWRIRGPNDTSYQDCDDDGETAAGGRVLHLMQLMGVWDVMVVVTRWYGGVLLGPDRFRIINTAAREALVLGGWCKEEKKEDVKKGKK
ncbi:impact family protein [Polyplosphaeria fusca]|uniref:Impact family protein n=1 Tax=Polyplosphaeria fusca TaxID=682080 RepID=A0A9P4R0Q0_9PLEO|nr:impact family protein [Polyplosphaeria fusca]